MTARTALADLIGTPEQEGHAVFPKAGAKAAGRLVEGLAREIGRPAAVAWVHTGAVVAWLGARPESTAAAWREILKGITEIHPSLVAFADPAVVDVWDTDPGPARIAEIAALWRAHPVDDPPYRPHGYLLGDAYQAVSGEARKRRALCQTPRFVSDLLMELGWVPALREHGDDTRMIDPACGTGHILVEALAWTMAGPDGGRDGRRVGMGPDRLHRALNAVHGVDIDPYAALLARLRIVMFANVLLRLGGCGYLPDDWPVHIAAADSLLDEAQPLLTRRRYHAVIMNPPYVTVKDPKINQAIRRRYPQVCHQRYSLALPFHALAHELLVPGGWTAQLTTNAFMRREYGRPYVETYLAGVDLQWIIDTSGAYIPGHGTPTVILVDRNQAPVGDLVSVVQGIRGEPTVPADPAGGRVWSSIIRGVAATAMTARTGASAAG